MRLRVVLVVLATATVMVVAFVVPLALLVRQEVRNDAIDRAKERAGRAAQDYADGSLDEAEPLVWIIDADRDPAGEVPLGALARARSGETVVIDVDGGAAALHPVLRDEGVAVAVAVAPDDELERGLTRAWLVLGGVVVALLVIAVVVADRLATSIVRPVTRLADVARQLSAGDRDTRVVPEGPAEVRDVGVALNQLAGRIDDMLAAEREAVADLSHRLRTPLTALRLDAEAVAGTPAGDRVLQHVDSLERAVDEVIAAARSPQRAQERVAASSDLAEVTADRAGYWGLIAEHQGRAWTVELPGRRLPVPLGRADLQAMLDAVLGNVFEHTPTSAAVRVRAEVNGNQAALMVEDGGPGFPDLGVAARGVSGRGSTGLGLDIVARSARTVGGSLELGRSRRGGARVVVRLPLLTTT